MVTLNAMDLSSTSSTLVLLTAVFIGLIVALAIALSFLSRTTGSTVQDAADGMARVIEAIRGRRR